jgi:hypothetical protein
MQLKLKWFYFALNTKENLNFASLSNKNGNLISTIVDMRIYIFS